ncbi:hypothetical protein Hanom_Chr03g00237011 [Helianthus anomalus]
MYEYEVLHNIFNKRLTYWTSSSLVFYRKSPCFERCVCCPKVQNSFGFSERTVTPGWWAQV